MRRIVTGQTEQGRSVIVADEEVVHVPYERQNGSTADVWGSDDIVPLPSDGSRPQYETSFPPPRGFRTKVVTFGPELPIETRIAASRNHATDTANHPYAHFEVDGSGMHSTQTIDIAVVLEGQIVLEVDDGAETTLQSGDMVVQNGTRHAWHNRTHEPCKILFVMNGAGEIA